MAFTQFSNMQPHPLGSADFSILWAASHPGVCDGRGRSQGNEANFPVGPQ